MNGIYVDDWKKHCVLVRDILKVFNRWDITMDYGIWSPHVWTGLKKETMCAAALLHVTMESQALEAMNCSCGFMDFHRDFLKVAEVRGCYWERGFEWSLHLFPKDPGNAPISS